MYDHRQIEAHWQKKWLSEQTFACDTSDKSKPKYYVLDMFPYPSGQGLHVGHPEGYTATDIIARAKRMQGYNVLHPMGWDAFGLPAEQYALSTGNHPNTFTRANIDHFRTQLQSLGFSYDWNREIATCDTDYYRWTQWIFTKLYERGLAYVDEIPVNWCPELKAVLANEEVIDGKSERGGYPVIRKPMRQWVLKITEYAERLLEDLDEVDWPSSTKDMQRNWIGKSSGAEVIFKIADHDLSFTVFTTRCDTLFGCTYCVLAPEHPFIQQITTAQQAAAVNAYIESVQSKSDLERTDLNKDKTGVFTGAYAINPVNGKKVPIWISDYVLASYGSGAIMAVPAHDQRDYDFAKKFGLDILPVVEGTDISKEANAAEGKHINSDFLNGLGKQEAIDTMLAFLEQEGIGQAKVSYKLRDWLFSRQRYWGEPIPIIHMEDGTMRTVPLEQLPLELPATDNYQPSDDGQSPLANVESFMNVEIDGQKGTRESNTMPQWAGSCWYYLRFIDPRNQEAIGDADLLAHWLPVDLYVGGAEHAVLHLLYARFWHKVLYDCGVVPTKEPFQKLFHQGMILGEDNQKMSKSRGNVINPDDILVSHGADALRVYEMFMGPLEAALPWSTTGLDGVRRWLERVHRFYTSHMKLVEKDDLDKVYHATVKKVTHDIDELKFNTAISQMMIFMNEAYKADGITKEHALGFLKCLNPFAPHLCEALWEQMGHDKTMAYEPWPTYDEAYLVETVHTIVVQINGKVRGKFDCSVDTSEQEIEEKAFAIPNIKRQLEGKTVRKVILVKGKVVNIVAN